MSETQTVDNTVNGPVQIPGSYTIPVPSTSGYVSVSPVNQDRADKISLLKKMHAIMNDLDYIQKDKKNDFHKYSYASEATIKAHVQEALVKHRVVFYTEVTNLQERPAGKTEKNGMLTTLTMVYHFADCDTGYELTGVGMGAGMDGEDKGIYKAITGTLKYILSSVFLFPTGDDAEATPEPDRVEKKPTGKPAAKAAPVVAAPATQVAGAPAAAERVVVLDKVSADALACIDCSKGIGGVTINDKHYTGDQIRASGQKKYTKDMCYSCQQLVATKAKEAAGRAVNTTAAA